jgi:hypothetical protein
MLENLPDSFLSQLADIDPVVGMLSKKLHKSCGVSCIDAWKFLTSRDRYELAMSNLCLRYSDLRGVRSVMYAKAASFDPEFVHYILIPGYQYAMYDAAGWACINDNIRILVPCLSFISKRKLRIHHTEAALIWNLADWNGSVHVLDWFLHNKPDIMKIAIPKMSGNNVNTVKWCIENLSKTSPAPVNWVKMKMNAIMNNYAESLELLDWVVNRFNF